MWIFRGRRRTSIAVAALLAVGIGLRISNAFHYKILWGFDALFNWRYIRLLTWRWELPAPDFSWATAHPPLFYYASAAICRLLGTPERDISVVVVRLIVTLMGLVMVWLACDFVRRVEPDNPRRALLAGGLILFLPVHIYMSAMVTEEIMAASLISMVAVGVASRTAGVRRSFRPLGFAAWMGIVAGLALLTKLTGILVILATVASVAVEGWRRGRLRVALQRAAVFAMIAGLVGGWYYVRNLVEYGYLYPYGLETHEIMFTMPPGERHVSDYYRFPLTVFSDPQVLEPRLQRSVWGSTYVTMWFDGHRVFLPTGTPAVSRVGGAILVLALLPTVAFLVGFSRGVRRAFAGTKGPDTFFTLLIAGTVAGYLAFTWKNPWFVTLKASFLLSLSVPFAYYTSEVLDAWLRAPGRGRFVVAGVLIGLLVLVVGTFTFSELFWNMDHMSKPGVLW